MSSSENLPLRDAAVGIAGYRSSRTDPLAGPTAAVLDLLARYGVTAARIDSRTWEELALMRALHREHAPTTALHGGGPVLIDRAPRLERELWVTRRDDIDVAVATAEHQRVTWLPVGIADPDLAAHAVETAHRAGLRVSAEGIGDVPGLGPDDHVGAMPDVLRRIDDTPLTLLQRWAEAADDGIRLLRGAVDAGATVGSGLLALRRAVFVREALDAPFLDELEPILPHASHLRELKRPGGYLVAKRQLRQHAGLREPTRAEAERAEAGWRNLLSAAATVADAVVPASRAPQFTSVPGYALHEELAVLTHAGLDPIPLN